jgi:hypothetical protein
MRVFAREHSFVTGAKPYVNAFAGVVSERGKDGSDFRPLVKFEKRFVLQLTETGLTLGYHLDPIQGPAGCRPREVSPLPSAAAHLIARHMPPRVYAWLCLRDRVPIKFAIQCISGALAHGDDNGSCTG